MPSATGNCTSNGKVPTRRRQFKVQILHLHHVIIRVKNVTPNVTPTTIDNQEVTPNVNLTADKNVTPNVAQNVAQSLSKKDDRISLISTRQ